MNQLTDCSLERSSCEKWCTTESEGKSFCFNRLSGFRRKLLLGKNITEAALEAFHDKLKASECDALFALLQSKQR